MEVIFETREECVAHFGDEHGNRLWDAVYAEQAYNPDLIMLRDAEIGVPYHYTFPDGRKAVVVLSENSVTMDNVPIADREETIHRLDAMYQRQIWSLYKKHPDDAVAFGNKWLREIHERRSDDGSLVFLELYFIIGFAVPTAE